ncbi:methyl-accepting chemotaxis protein [Leptospira idonii]|uniref:Methyl-accepting chemotaxis protein n=1 Tax=Leptospira idonii TaxID=1193500 RepID=A0A4R9M1I9_9LEPT|nr:methyl-accepting chemotaxis protein [Leptospira idonii]TGN19557.1 methyl-accepting chemotaxis protein [Leptospira idonii]
MTIKQKLALGTSIFTLLTLGIILTTISFVIYRNAKSEAIETLTIISEKMSLEAGAYLSGPLNEAYIMKKLLEEGSILDRSEVLKVLNVLTASNDSILGTYVIFEPNAFDGQDARFKNTLYHDRTGRLIPYSVKSGDKIIIEPVVGYEEESAEFYFLPKKSQSLELLPPFSYKIDGKDVMMVSLVYPVLKGNKFIGISGADISLETIQAYFKTIRLFEGQGKITFVASNGIVLFDGFHPEEGAVEWKNELDPNVNQAMLEDQKRIYIEGDYLHISTPIRLVAGVKPWTIRISYPLGLITKEIEFIFWLSLFLGSAGIFICVVANYMIFHRFVDIRLQDLLRFADKASKGDLTTHLTENRNDEMGRLVRSVGIMTDNIRQILTVAQTSGGDLSGTTKQMENSILELSDLAQSQAASSEEASATVEELNASSETINGNVKQAVENTKSIHISLVKIQDLVQNITGEVEAFGNIAVGANQKAEEGKNMASLTSQAIEEIQEKSQTITEFSEVISSISEKTSLLALNAAIEAARAGESGRGFAVVAEEISKLASQAAESVSQINHLSAGALESIDRGGAQVQKLISVLREITQEVSVIFEKAKNIIPMIQDQKSKTNQIYSEIEEISALVQAIQQSTEEQKRATDELANMTVNISNGSQILSDQAAMMTENSNRMTGISSKLGNVLQKFKL